MILRFLTEMHDTSLFGLILYRRILEMNQIKLYTFLLLGLF